MRTRINNAAIAHEMWGWTEKNLALNDCRNLQIYLNLVRINLFIVAFLSNPVYTITYDVNIRQSYADHVYGI